MITIIVDVITMKGVMVMIKIKSQQKGCCLIISYVSVNLLYYYLLASCLYFKVTF